MEIYKIVCLITTFLIMFFIISYILRDVFMDMRSRNISHMNKMKEQKSAQVKLQKKPNFKVYKGSNKKKVTKNKNAPKLIKIK